MTTETTGREFLLRQKIIDTATLLWPQKPGLQILVWRSIDDRHNDHFTATLFDPLAVIDDYRTHPVPGLNHPVLLVHGNEATSLLGAVEELLDRVRELLEQVSSRCGCRCVCGCGVSSQESDSSADSDVDSSVDWVDGFVECDLYQHQYRIDSSG
ncbi:hypothetical protein BDV97DRAFT_366484 [Delphinella strobiligena]|nr:hypothetical protein BDV97DRAFT_366484 [Delphinella strobiligena]